MKKSIILISFVLIFISCKKYPDNYLWFKNPEHLYPFNGKITKYAVNGSDSLQFLNAFVNQNICAGAKFSDFHFFSYDAGSNYHQNTFVLGCGMSNSFSYNFNNDKTSIYITLNPDTTMNKSFYLFKKMLFINSNVEWQIIRLSREGPFIIKSKNLQNTYEIQIGN